MTITYIKSNIYAYVVIFVSCVYFGQKIQDRKFMVDGLRQIKTINYILAYEEINKSRQIALIDHANYKLTRHLNM